MTGGERQRRQRRRRRPESAPPNVRRAACPSVLCPPQPVKLAPAATGVNIAPCSRRSPPSSGVAGAIAAAPGRTITVVATEDVGAPLERAFASALYARAAAADAEMRWDDARLLYRQAAEAWTAIARTRPSRALGSAIAKAEREATVRKRCSRAGAASASRSATSPRRRGAPSCGGRRWRRRTSCGAS